MNRFLTSFGFLAVKTCFEVKITSDEKLSGFTIKALAELLANGTESEIGAEKSVTVKSENLGSWATLL